MRYLPIGQDLFITNRKNFAKVLEADTLAVFNANDIMPTNADGVMPFRQNNDLFYLSGVDQEETILVLFPSHPNPELREILFIKETSELIAIWEGDKLTKKQASEVSGIKNVKWIEDFEDVFNNLLSDAASVYLNSNEHSRNSTEVQTRNDRFNDRFKKEFPEKDTKLSAPLLQELRMVKSGKEVELMQHACNITEKGFRRILKMIEPGRYEYEVEAELTHEFLLNRSRGHAYQPIVASGANACVLHYISNNEQLKEGDLILMDFGAEYANYNSDLTRCVPASGRFTPRQKEVYNAVLRTMKFAKTILIPGNTYKKYTQEVCGHIEKELVDLGLLTTDEIRNQPKDKPAFRKYFMHGVSHSIGLDVHDVENRERPFEEGMVFTCEPGIYIREEGIGVRIENDFLLTHEGNFDLMKNIPIEVEEIENLMNEGK